jgi:hypothetical protein
VLCLSGAAQAAAPPPSSTANCRGTVSPTPSADEPNLLDYRFRCDTGLTAYTIVVNRGPLGVETLDDFSTNASIFEPDGTTPDPTTTWSCEGTVPSDGFNCSTGGGTSKMQAWSYTEGTLDTTDPYCKHFPDGAKPGTPAERQASIQLVVTDVTGAQDGPFHLFYTGTCKWVPDRVPHPKKKAKHTKHH